MYPYAQASGGANGEIAGSISAAQLPTVPAFYFRLKASAANAGKVYIGFSASVTKADGTTDTTTGWQLSAGEDTGWLPLKNLNMLWRICDNAADNLTYIVLNV